jgi:hypothetical protein
MLIASDEKTKRFILRIGKQRIAFDFTGATSDAGCAPSGDSRWTAAQIGPRGPCGW